MGAAWVADRLWEQLGIGKQIVEVAERRRGPGRRVDPAVVERVIFAMVANRLSPTPLSKLAGCLWVADRVFIGGLAEVSDDACYRAMDFFLTALGELQQAVFFSVANLLNLEVDSLFFDTSSTDWETDSADDALLDDTDDGGDEAVRAVEGAWRTDGHAKDHRPDLSQIVIGMAVTREGIPVRGWTFPGDTSDQVLIRTVKDDLSDWNLNRVIWALDRGFTSAANRRYLQRGGGHYIMGEKLRGDSAEAAAALSRQGRYHSVAGNLRVKEVRVDDGEGRDRFVICHNPDAATRDAAVRDEIVARLAERIDGSDTLSAASGPNSPAGSRPSQRSPGSCAPPPAGCCASTGPRCMPTQASTASSCCEPATSASPPPTSPRATRASTKPNEDGETSSPPSTCAPSTITAKTASAPTSSCSGWPCCSYASRRRPWATPGATSATNSNGCTWSPSPPPKAKSPNVANSPPANGPSSPPSSCPSRPASSTSPPARPAA
jgi:hypothetical protein